MQRRDFLKYFLSLNFAFCFGCSSQRKIQDLTEISIPICYHCNLNCASCNHFAPIAPKYEVSLDVFEKDLVQLKKISGNSIKTIRLLGGEPLLHREIEKLLVITNKYFKDTKKIILTNGILLKDMSLRFWNVCSINNIQINYTRYPIKDSDFLLNQAIDIAQKFNVKIKITENKKGYFDLAKLSCKKNLFPKCSKCNMYNSDIQLDNGFLYSCPVMANVRFLKSYFKDYKFNLPDVEKLNIHSVKTKKEILSFLNKDKKFSYHCNYGDYTRNIWMSSKQELSEWYDVSTLDKV